MGDEPADFHPTHVAPTDGLATWAHPDFSEPSARLDPLLPVRVTDVRGDWARVACSNGWTAWADGRMLVSLPQRPPSGGRQPLSFAADPRPLLQRLEHALTQYREAAEDLAEGTIDLETFRHLTHGLRLGAVLDGEAGWLLDLDEGCWYYCDGLRLRTLATTEPPTGSDQASDVGSGAGSYPATSASAEPVAEPPRRGTF
ncbi:hypothetical protein [Streptacidiphilus melanogenes]|uniref:hypothetical protein n=1 Tax=Streptacidiphilus melanogenes TaxID=411235 RepID=UPI0007C7E3A2|nr:hypothetical protein [Streptacidiphilus melanogenes]